jgi:hypothetical protein
MGFSSVMLIKYQDAWNLEEMFKCTFTNIDTVHPTLWQPNIIHILWFHSLDILSEGSFVPYAALLRSRSYFLYNFLREKWSTAWMQ